MDEQQVWSLLRRQRHSFLNHLQVISGWLQMNQPDRARRYLEFVAEEIAGASQAVRAVSPALGLVILDIALEAETHGARLAWRIHGALPDEQAEGLREAVIQACMAAGKAGDGGRLVTVTLGSDGYSVHTPSDAGEG